MLRRHPLQFSLPYPVLAADGAAERQRATRQPAEERLNVRTFVFTFIEHDQQVKITVTDMTDKRRIKTGGRNVGGRGADAGTQTGQRDADIGGQPLAAFVKA